MATPDTSLLPDETGLGAENRSAWPVPPAPATDWIDLVSPGSDRHAHVLQYMVDRIEHSERAMNAFYPRWKAMELKVQAYVKLPDWEEFLRQANMKGERPKAVSIHVPYTHATIATIVTFLMHVFTGRRPMFQVGTHKKEVTMNARNMETVLQFQADYSRLPRELFSFLQDGQVYGLGIARPYWRELLAKRTKKIPTQLVGMDGRPITSMTTARDIEMVYQGNVVECLDPFMFFPDPRMPLTDVARKGEFVFWRLFEGKHILKREEAAGNIKYVDYAGQTLPTNEAWQLDRINLAGGEMVPSYKERSGGKGVKYAVQIDQGTVEIIPRELGLGDSEIPEKAIVTILNKKQIVQLQPYDADHGMHPVCVSEPYKFSHGFGNLGVADYIAPINDLISWFFNSHMDNVRRVVNDSFIVDPMMVEMQDLKKEGPGRIIRLKKAARGMDVRTAIQQLPIVDVTRGHAEDGERLFGIGERISGVSDNRMGLQDSGGRKTATEVRQAGELGASRLASIAKLISAQALVDLTEQMVCNTQQYLSEEYFLSIVGQEGLMAPITISPDMLNGNFNYPVHDGTLPLDRVALFEVWERILQAVMTNPMFSMNYDVGRIFEYTAELGGAKNISAFRMVPGSPEQIQAMLQSGVVASAGQVAGSLPSGGGGGARGSFPQPPQRLLGAGR